MSSDSRRIYETFRSHSIEPGVGDMIANTNPGCAHHGSEGEVMTIESLPEDMGKIISYRVTNDGPTYRSGDVLRKTMDQLSPMRFLDDDQFDSAGWPSAGSSDDIDRGEPRFIRTRDRGTIKAHRGDPEYDMYTADEDVSPREMMREWFARRNNNILKD